MIAYLKGTLVIKAQGYIVIDVNSVGYKVFMTDTSIENLKIEEEIKIFTYMRVREDDISLYGFLSNEELMMFELLISVGGIGAKSAISILSNISPSKFALAVITNDVSALKALPGIGAKSAQRIILELRDKIKTEDTISNDETSSATSKLNENSQDATDALQVLGYSRKDIEKVFEKIDSKDLSKIGLKNLAR